MRVCASVDLVWLDGDYTEVEGLEAACSQCGNAQESFGTTSASARRSLLMLRKTCPRGESNLYVECR